VSHWVTLTISHSHTHFTGSVSQCQSIHSAVTLPPPAQSIHSVSQSITESMWCLSVDTTSNLLHTLHDNDNTHLVLCTKVMDWLSTVVSSWHGWLTRIMNHSFTWVWSRCVCHGVCVCGSAGSVMHLPPVSSSTVRLTKTVSITWSPIWLWEWLTYSLSNY